MKQVEQFPSFKPLKITFTKRQVPSWASFFQCFGLFKKVGRIISQNEYVINVFCNSGRTSLLERMAGETKGELTYLALGDDTTIPVTTDVALGNELFRKAIASSSASGLTLSTSTFITSTEGNHTYKEMGLYGDDAGAGADSGTLFTHLTIDETKASGQSVTIDYDIVAS